MSKIKTKTVSAYELNKYGEAHYNKISDWKTFLQLKEEFFSKKGSLLVTANEVKEYRFRKDSWSKIAKKYSFKLNHCFIAVDDCFLVHKDDVQQDANGTFFFRIKPTNDGSAKVQSMKKGKGIICFCKDFSCGEDNVSYQVIRFTGEKFLKSSSMSSKDL